MTCILIMGPPGSGKGTQAVAIAEHHRVPAISTGDIFRANVDAGTPLGRVAREYMEAGEYVPDSVTTAMLRERVDRPDCRQGFILDGYPRTMAQVAALDEILEETAHELRAVLALDVDRSDLVDRLVLRAATDGRTDDTEDVIRRRLELYTEETGPLLAEYDSRGVLVRLDGSGTRADVAARVADVFDARV
ncbi:adenylate kinase [Marmoricola sp. URHA0025 HA25]